MYLLMYKKWVSMNNKDRKIWTEKSSISHTAMARFVSSANNILKSVNDQLKRMDGRTTILSTDSLDINSVITAQKLNMFRLILTWNSVPNIIRQDDIHGQKISLKSFETMGLSKMTDEKMEELIPNYCKVTVAAEKEGEQEDEFFEIPWERSTKGIY